MSGLPTETDKQTDVEMFRSLSDLLPQMVFIAEPGNHVTYFNRRWFEYTGISFGDNSIETWMTVIHPDDIDPILKSWGEAEKLGKPWVHEYRVRRHDGVYRWHLGRSVPDRENGTRRIGSITDIEDQKRIERDLQEAKETLETKVAERTWELTQASAFLDSVIENIPNMIFVKDAKDLRFVRFNRAGEDLIGLPRSALIGKNDFDFFPAEEAKAFQAKDRDVIAGHRIVDIPEEPISTAKQGVRLLHTKKIPVFDSHGRPQYLVGISEDITDLKKVEKERLEFMQAQILAKEAEKSAERLNFLAEASALLGSSLDMDTTLTNLTKLAAPAIADWCSVQILEPDKTLRQVAVSHRDPAKVKLAQELNERNANNPNTPVGAPVAVRTGNSNWARVITDSQLHEVARDENHFKLLKIAGMRSFICVPIISRAQVLGAITLMMTDDSGRNYTEADLRLAEDLSVRVGFAVENARLYREAQNLNRVKDEFLATLSHELRTPLNVILGHSEILREDAGEMPPEEVSASIEAIYRNAKTQTGLIGDLLDVSSIITGKVSYKPAETNPKDTVTSIIDSFKPTAEAKGVRLDCDLKSAPQTVLADPTRLHQIVWNLVSNAIKFTPRDGKVSVKVDSSAIDWNIEVSDTGRGIDPDFLPYVFDRFRQEDASSTRKYGGLGLGLSIVRHLVELHGGQVMADSLGKGKGATFRVTMPLKGIRPEVAAELKPSIADIPLEKKQANVQLKGIKVLLVEDSPDSRLLIGKMLTRAGAELVEADSAAEARTKLKNYKPDVIVSDIGMPDENGIEFMRGLRASGANHTPAIALTAYVRAEEIESALAAGFQAHVGKPVSSILLAKTIQQVIK